MLEPNDASITINRPMKGELYVTGTDMRDMP